MVGLFIMSPVLAVDKYFYIVDIGYYILCKNNNESILKLNIK